MIEMRIGVFVLCMLGAVFIGITLMTLATAIGRGNAGEEERNA